MEAVIEKINSRNIKIIKKIDDTYYIDSIVPLEWYERYKNNKVYLLKNNTGEYVGYVLIAGIKKELYDAFKSLVLIGDCSLNPDMFDFSSDYKYLASMVLLKDYRNKGMGSNLLQKVLSNEKGKIIVISTSKEGYRVLKKYFDLETKISNKVTLFEKDL